MMEFHPAFLASLFVLVSIASYLFPPLPEILFFFSLFLFFFSPSNQSDDVLKEKKKRVLHVFTLATQPSVGGEMRGRKLLCQSSNMNERKKRRPSNNPGFSSSSSPSSLQIWREKKVLSRFYRGERGESQIWPGINSQPTTSFNFHSCCENFIFLSLKKKVEWTFVARKWSSLQPLEKKKTKVKVSCGTIAIWRPLIDFYDVLLPDQQQQQDVKAQWDPAIVEKIFRCIGKKLQQQ